jgi:hypothetical protein
MALDICMILLREGNSLLPSSIERELRSRYPELEASITDDKGGTPSFKLKNAELILGSMPAPIPWSDLEGPCATSVLWKNAAEEVRLHQAHIIVTLLSQLNPVEHSVLLTQTTTAILAACDAAIGVYWGSATLVAPKDIFIEFAERVLPLGPPLDIWVDFRVGWETRTTSVGFTQGMEALGHMEMEMHGVPEKPGELRQRLQDLARYLLRNGAVIHDGETVGQNAEEKLRVVYSKSAFGHDKTVMRLNYEGREARPWWKLW